jgi:hypothetical protein
MINISINENVYWKFRLKLANFSNFEIPSPSFPTPSALSACIEFYLIKFKIQYEYRFFFVSSNIINLRRYLIINISINEIFYLKSRFKVVKFSNFEIPSPNLPAPLSRILFILINLKIQNEFRFFCCNNYYYFKMKLNYKYFYKSKFLLEFQIHSSQIQQF